MQWRIQGGAVGVAAPTFGFDFALFSSNFLLKVRIFVASAPPPPFGLIFLIRTPVQKFLDPPLR
jgi:hypothetical protein